MAILDRAKAIGGLLGKGLGVVMSFQRKVEKSQRKFHQSVQSWQDGLRVARSISRDLLTSMRLGNSVERVADFHNAERPILLLYGFGSTRRTLRIMELRLRRRLDRCVFSLNLGGYRDTLNTSGIINLAKLVDEKVETICRRYDIQDIDIVAHSKGGLIARYYVKRLNGARRVRHLVTLGTPHRGTWVATAALPALGWWARSLWQMTPISPFIRDLQKGPWPAGVRFTSIASTADWLAPPFRARIELLPGEPTRNISVDHVAHNAMLYSKEVFEHVVVALAEELLPTPDTDETGKEDGTELPPTPAKPAEEEAA